MLRDVASVTVLAVALGMAAYGALRKLQPERAARLGGRVIAAPYSVIDLCGVALLCIILLGGLMSEHESLPDEKLGLQSLLVNLVFMLGLCLCLLLYLGVMRGQNPAELFGLRRLSVHAAARQALAYIIPLYILVGFITYLILHHVLKDAWPEAGPQEMVKTFHGATDPAMRVLMAVAAVIVAPLVEETVFRGFIYGTLKRFTDGWFAALCSAALFSIVHLHIGSAVPLFVLALGFCLAYEHTGSLLVPVFMHAFFNGTSLVLMMLFPNAAS